MNKTASEVYRPVHDLIKELSAASDTDRKDIIGRLHNAGKKAENEFRQLDTRFQELKERNEELSDMLREAHADPDIGME